MTTTKLDHIAQQYGSEYQGYPLFLKALDDHKLLIVVGVTPQLKVLFCPESEHSKKLDQMGISDEVKVDSPEIDDNYVIRTSEPEALKSRIAEIGPLLSKLFPFVELELTSREYRLLKEIPANDETTVSQALDALVELVQATAAES